MSNRISHEQYLRELGEPRGKTVVPTSYELFDKCIHRFVAEVDFFCSAPYFAQLVKKLAKSVDARLNLCQVRGNVVYVQSEEQTQGFDEQIVDPQVEAVDDPALAEFLS